MRFLWPLKTGLCLLLAVAVQAGSAMNLYLSKDEDDGHAYVIANGAMLKADDAVKIRKFLNVQAVRGIPTAIFITSPGGFGELMSQFAKAIVEPSNELYHKHSLFNLIIVNEECSSACVILMSHLTSTRNQNALKMMVAPDAKFGFHSPVEMRDGAVVSILDQIERETRIRTQIRLLTAAGVNPEWLKKNEDVLRSQNMTFMTGDQLCTGDSYILTRESCVYGKNDLGALASSRLNISIQDAEAARLAITPRTKSNPVPPQRTKKPAPPKNPVEPTKRAGNGRSLINP